MKREEELTVSVKNLTRPIIGIENRTALEAFDIMVARIEGALAYPNSSPLEPHSPNVQVPIELLKSIWAEMYHGVGGEHGIDDGIAQWNLDQVVDILADANALPDTAHPPKPQPTEGISDANNVPDYIVQASLDKARQVLEATEGVAHEKGSIDALMIGSYVNDAAHNLLVNHTGIEGGCPRVDWYKLRHEIACALETAIYDFRVASAAPTGWRAE